MIYNFIINIIKIKIFNIIRDFHLCICIKRILNYLLNYIYEVQLVLLYFVFNPAQVLVPHTG